MTNAWLTHLKAFYAKNKSKMSYSQAMKAAKKTYKPAKPPTTGRKARKKTKNTRALGCSYRGNRRQDSYWPG